MQNRQNIKLFKYLIIMITTVFVIIIIPEIISISLAQEETKSNTVDKNDILLQNGDAIRLLIWEGWYSPSDKSILSSFNGEFVIDGNGQIRLPVIGLFQVAGKKNSEIEIELQEKLKPFSKTPVVTCIPLIRVTLFGAFNRQGTYRIKTEASFWELVDQAGGPKDRIDFEKTIVKRNGVVILENVIQAFEKGISLTDMGIKSGDQVYAPEKSSFNFDKFSRYFNFGVSIIMLGATISSYQTYKR